MRMSSQGVEYTLWQGKMPHNSGLTGEEIDYGNGRVGNVTKPSVFVYLPKGASKATPAVVICPGGGYARLAMNHEGHEVAQWLNSLGIAGIVLKYRMPNGHSEIPLADAQQALKLVRSRSAEWNIDAHKVGIAGFSAGGHLAATATTHFTDSLDRPDFSILFYAVISMNPAITHQGSLSLLIGKEPSEEKIKFYSNELHITPQTPPVALLLSDDDKTVPPRNSSEFYDALKKNNVPAAMYIFPSGGHGWGMNDSFAYKSLWQELLKKWLLDTVK